MKVISLLLLTCLLCFPVTAEELTTSNLVPGISEFTTSGGTSFGTGSGCSSGAYCTSGTNAGGGTYTSSFDVPLTEAEVQLGFTLNSAITISSHSSNAQLSTCADGVLQSGDCRDIFRLTVTLQDAGATVETFTHQEEMDFSGLQDFAFTDVVAVNTYGALTGIYELFGIDAGFPVGFYGPQFSSPSLTIDYQTAFVQEEVLTAITEQIETETQEIIQATVDPDPTPVAPVPVEESVVISTVLDTADTLAPPVDILPPIITVVAIPEAPELVESIPALVTFDTTIVSAPPVDVPPVVIAAPVSAPPVVIAAPVSAPPPPVDVPTIVSAPPVDVPPPVTVVDIPVATETLAPASSPSAAAPAPAPEPVAPAIQPIAQVSETQQAQESQAEAQIEAAVEAPAPEPAVEAPAPESESTEPATEVAEVTTEPEVAESTESTVEPESETAEEPAPKAASKSTKSTARRKVVATTALSKVSVATVSVPVTPAIAAQAVVDAIAPSQKYGAAAQTVTLIAMGIIAQNRGLFKGPGIPDAATGFFSTSTIPDGPSIVDRMTNYRFSGQANGLHNALIESQWSK